MRCLISKILIDYHEESGKTLPGMVRTHIKNCRNCRVYMNLGKQLEETDSDTGISDSSIHELNKKIFSHLKNPGEENIVKLKSRIFSFVPVAATLFFIIISLGIILFQNLRKPQVISGSNPIINVAATKNLKNIGDLFTNVESPMVREAEDLKRTINSAKEYLSSVMDFGLPGIPD
ncbi:MAG: hypothetical protein KAR14_00885 [Candidatus Aminicenantes bacterium]|nr:hypothetical protein [Candidatus Aminicenantes bacterium]